MMVLLAQHMKVYPNPVGPAGTDLEASPAARRAALASLAHAQSFGAGTLPQDLCLDPLTVRALRSGKAICSSGRLSTRQKG